MSSVATEIEINFSPLLHTYTLEEFWELPDPDDRSHYELALGVRELWLADPVT